MKWNGLASLVLACLLNPVAGALSLYDVGNSLTNDSYPDAMPALAQDSGLLLSTGYHIRSSASLTYMVTVPSDVTLFKPSTLDVALISQPFDAIALQPYNGFDSPTYASERNAIISVVERVIQKYPGRATFYLYAAWPNLSDTGGYFDGYWGQTAPVDTQGPVKANRIFFDTLLADLRAYFGSRASIRVIPVGDVLARIDRDGKGGLIPGITDMNMLYRDQLHMGEVGRFVAASTVIATLFQQKPSSGATQAQYQFNDGAAQLTPQLAAQLEGIIWSVVSADDRTRAASSSSTSSSSSSVSSSTGSSSSSSSASSSTSSASSSMASSSISDSSSSSSNSSSSASVASSSDSSGSDTGSTPMAGAGSLDWLMLFGLVTVMTTRGAARRRIGNVDA